MNKAEPVAEALQTVGTWEPWQVVFIVLPIFALIGFYMYLKNKKNGKKSSNGNGYSKSIDILNGEIGKVVDSLREVREENRKLSGKVEVFMINSESKDVEHKTRIERLEKDVERLINGN